MPRRYSLVTLQPLEEQHAASSQEVSAPISSSAHPLPEERVRDLLPGHSPWQVLISSAEDEFWVEWSLCFPQRRFPYQAGTRVTFEGTVYQIEVVLPGYLHLRSISTSTSVVPLSAQEVADDLEASLKRKDSRRRNRLASVRLRVMLPLIGGEGLRTYYELAIAELPATLRDSNWPQWVRSCYLQLYQEHAGLLACWQVGEEGIPTAYRLILSPEKFATQHVYTQKKQLAGKSVPIFSLDATEAEQLLPLISAISLPATPVLVAPQAFFSDHITIPDEVYYRPIEKLELSQALIQLLKESGYETIGEVLQQRERVLLEDVGQDAMEQIARALRDTQCLPTPGAHCEMYFLPTTRTYDHPDYGPMRLVYASPIVERLLNRRQWGIVERHWLTEEQIACALPYERAWRNYDPNDRRDFVYQKAIQQGLLDPALPMVVEETNREDHEALEELHNRVPVQKELYVPQEMIELAQLLHLSPEQTVLETIEFYLLHPEKSTDAYFLPSWELDLLKEALVRDQQVARRLPRRFYPTTVWAPRGITHVSHTRDMIQGKKIRKERTELTGSVVIIGLLVKTPLIDHLVVRPPKIVRCSVPGPLIHREPHYVPSSLVPSQKRFVA